MSSPSLLSSTTSSTILSTLLLILLGAFLPSIVSYLSSKSRDQELYTDTEAILLNLELPKSRWFNMGYWTSPPSSSSSSSTPLSFSKAAETLAHLVGTKANLQPGDTILEVGYGNGDSCLLWGRPVLSGGFGVRKILGITSLEGQRVIAGGSFFRVVGGELCCPVERGADASLFVVTVQRTNTVSTEQGEGKEAGEPIYDLKQGDAARSESYDFVTKGSLDALVAVDCAYQLLKPGSKLAMTDLLLSPPSSTSTLFQRLLDSLLLSLLFRLSGVPSGNIVSLHTYKEELSKYYEEIQVEDISEHVFPGFLEFLERRNEEVGQGSKILGSGWKGLMRYGEIVAWYSGYNGLGQGKDKRGREKLRFVLVSAVRKGLD